MSETNPDGWREEFEREFESKCYDDIAAFFDKILLAKEEEIKELKGKINSEPSEGTKWVSLETDEPEAEENCLWCKVPISEPPYSGSMNDTDFPKNYFTHFMRLPNSFFPASLREDINTDKK